MKTVNNKKNRIIKPGSFFLACFIVFTAALLWNLFHCTEYSWVSADLFPAEDAEESAGTAGIELKDDTPLVMRASSEQDDADRAAKGIGKKPRLRGAALLGYANSHLLKYTDETVSVEIVRIGTGEVVGSGTLALKNQTPYPNDETAVYIALSEPVTQLLPQELEIRFSASGLTRNGLLIAGGGAEKGKDRPFARLYYEKKKWNPVMPILYYVLEILAVLGCMLLYGERRLPLFHSRRQEVLPEQGGFSPADNKAGRTGTDSMPRLRVRQLAVPAVLFLFIGFLMLYTYVHVIKKTAAACAGDLMTGGSRNEDVIALEPGMILRQSVIAGEDSLSGIGVRLVQEEGQKIASVKKAACADTVLEWKLLDESGTAELTSGSGPVKDLKKVSSLLSKDITDKTILTAADESFVLPLDSPVLEARGKKFVLEISVPEKGSDQESIYLLAASDTNGEIRTGRAGYSSISSSDQEVLPSELCLMGTYQCNGFITGMYCRICVLVLFMLAGLYYAAHRFARLQINVSRQVAAMYLVSALCMGMIFSFLTPAYTVSDERTHIDTVYILSNRILEIRDIPGPMRILRRACDIDSSIANTMPVTAERYRAVHEDLFKAAPQTGAAMSADTDHSEGEGKSEGSSEVRIPSGRELTPAFTRNALSNASILCYLPAAIGFSAARILGRNMITMVMAARWLNLIVCAWIMYLAIRRMPYGASALAVIGLFPKTLQQMASCSYDGMVAAGTFLFISLCLAAAYDENVSISDLLVLLLTGLYVASCKGGTYLPVLGMAFLIPAARAGRGRKMQKGWLAVSLASVGGAAFLFLGKYIARLLTMFGRESGAATVAFGTRKLYTLSDFIQSPVKLVRIYINTIIVRGDGLVGELVGKNLSQRWYIVYAFIGLAILGILRRSCSRPGQEDPADKNHVALAGRIWILFLTAGSVSLIFLSMLLAFTEKDMAYIDGLQGRYFLPIAILPLLAAENGLVRRDGIGDTAILYTADFLLAVTFCEILLAYLAPV